ncbi:MAG TPA: PP2C family protein-serine/threonine phosphatase [Thermoanaerobaculia bacterium]|nr:PP2C family protein-serine/threonine phosphatase [Thermoanaerobaculia bacterium]
MPGTGLERRHLPTAAALAAGAVVLALGVGLARARLPEWRPGPLPDRRLLQRELAAVAARCGLRLAGSRPSLEIVEMSRRRRVRDEVPLTSVLPEALLAIRVEQPAVLAGAAGIVQPLQVWFDAGPRPLAIEWKPSGLTALTSLERRPGASSGELAAAFAAALLVPGERRGATVPLVVAGFPLDLFDVAGAGPPRHLTAVAVSTAVEASRNAGSAESAIGGWDRLAPLNETHETVQQQLAMLGVAILFCVLAIRRRLGIANAVWLAALAGLAVLPAALRQPDAAAAAVAVAKVALESAWLAVLWATAESLWRATDPRFDGVLDLLRTWRLPARAGAALLFGVGLGAAAAGLGLGAAALAATLPGGRLQALSVDLPVIDGFDGPLAAGITAGALVALLLACARRVSPRRWVLYPAALAAALVLSPVQLQPWPLELAAGTAVAGVLVAAAEMGGPATLLAAALAYRLAPAAVFTAGHLAWLPGSFALAAGALAVLVGVGAVAARRAPRQEDELVVPPAFVLRLERERRLEVEMELLARMQRGLLPREVPVVPGWEIAARSLLAERAGGDLYDFVRDRAGRWWIAAGDVAGHGYSCAIAQAMVKAALATLLGDGRSPAAVLAETDRILRTAGGGRSFTSLALLRFDPASGEALLANAGHPYPILAAPGEAAREVALPGLPLGQGPPRRYADLPLALAAGATLVLCSDGLFEAAGAGRGSVEPYGYDRPRQLLDELAGRPAAAVLEGLLADWRRHRGAGPPDDDTTVVVLRRR